MKILNFGSLNIDMVYDVINFVKPGETISSTKYSVFCGGKGLNQSIALARAGVDLYHAGKVSTDGRSLVEILNENSVKTDFVSLDGTYTGHAIIQVDSKGQNSILLCGGANKELTKEYIDFVLNHFEANDILVLQNEINHLEYIINKANKKGMRIVLNPSPIDKKIIEIDFNMINLLVLNEIEGKAIANVLQEEEIIDKLIYKYPNLKIVLTLGENGSMYGENNFRLTEQILKTEVVDTTAAGDTFLGYFVAGLILDKSPSECLNLATVASSLAVSKKGASISIPFMKEVLERNDKHDE
ncbi:MAG: ribokinase [Clostridium sp.]|uniref:ribokinase n=1 Tax=Clostridium sp. TaxID=1506 RepID=UPI003D6D8911